MDEPTTDWTYSLEAALEEIARIGKEYDLPQHIKDLFHASAGTPDDCKMLGDGYSLELALEAVQRHLRDGVQI